MMENDQYVTLIEKLGGLEEGIRGIHRRQDITNGRIAKTEEKVIDLDKKNVDICHDIRALKERNEHVDAEYTAARENKTYWSRMLIERIVWIVLALAMLVLSKTGIINVNIP